MLYAGFLFTPSEAGVNPLAPLSELAFLSNNGVDAWATATGLATLGFVLIAIDLMTTLRNMRAPGHGLAAGAGLLLGRRDLLLAAARDRPGHAGRDDDAADRPQLRRHLLRRRLRRRAAALAAPELDLLLRRLHADPDHRLGAIAEIVPAFARKPLFNRGAVIGSLVAIAVIGTLAWMQNMLTAPIGIGWMYFAMMMSLALIVPFGLIVFNLIATMVGGTLRMRAPLLFAARRDLDDLDRPRAPRSSTRWSPSPGACKNTTDATAATHFALVGGAVFGGFAALHYWFPKMTGRTMGESLARISFWTMALGILLAFVPLFLAGGEQGQVVDAYKFFGGTGVNAYNLIASIGAFVLAAGIVLTLVNAILSRDNGARGRPRPLGRRLARVVRALAAGAAQLRRPARRAQRPADARHPRRDRPPHQPRRASRLASPSR